MSRLNKYKESLTRFVKKNKDYTLDDISLDYITQIDLVIPILVLTIMNNQMTAITVRIVWTILFYTIRLIQ